MKVKEYDHWAWMLLFIAVVGAFAGANLIVGFTYSLFHSDWLR